MHFLRAECSPDYYHAYTAMDTQDGPRRQQPDLGNQPLLYRDDQLPPLTTLIGECGLVMVDCISECGLVMADCISECGSV